MKVRTTSARTRGEKSAVRYKRSAVKFFSFIKNVIFFTFSLTSPPAPPLQLAFHLAALSPGRAAAVSKYGCHEAQPFGETRGGTNLDSEARLCSLYLSRFRLRCCATKQRPRLRRRLRLYFRLSHSLSPSFSLSLSPQTRVWGGRPRCSCVTSGTPARTETVCSAAAALFHLFLSSALRLFSVALQKLGHQPLWKQPCGAAICVLPSFLIRVQSWMARICDITSDTFQPTPLLHPCVPLLHRSVLRRGHRSAQQRLPEGTGENYTL